MANTVAYNNGSNPVGSIKKGVVSINIDNSLITSGLTWRNGIEFTNQYIIYSDTYTQGIDTQQNAKPCAWSCDYNDTALRDLINSLPPLIGQPKYNTLSDAIAWLEGQNKYFLVNQNYPEIVTSGCVLNMDAGMSGSYPNARTTWYDISGNQKNGTMQNGVLWVNSGTSSSMTFDGTDDTVNLGNNLNLGTSPFTLEYLAKSDINTNQYAKIISKGIYLGGGWTSYFGRDPSSLTYSISIQYGNSTTGWMGLSGLQIASPNKWYHVIYTKDANNNFTSYVNGITGQTKVETYDFDTQAYNYVIGGNSGGSEKFKGNIQFVRQYNRAFSQSDVLQNYYKGKLVTSGLTLALDAGNLVSYSGAGTTWYDMTPNGNNGNLGNGPTYSGGTVPSLVFDGMDDYVSLPQSLLPDNFTYSIWVMRDGTGNQGTRGIVISNGSTYIDVGFNNKILFSLILSGGSQNLIQSANGVVASVGVWAHYAATYNRQQAKLYYNGVEVGSSNYTLPPINDFSTFTIGSYAGGSYNLNGKISNVQYYDRALSASEIQQNFNTYRRRFGI